MANERNNNPKITIKQGNKCKDDRIYYLNNVQVTFKDITDLLVLMWANEDINYPPVNGFKGAQMLKDFLDEAYNKREITSEMLKRYRL